MAAPGTIRFAEVASNPPTPPVGYAIVFIKTDNVFYIMDSSGVVTPLGSASSITSLSGDVIGSGPGVAVTTVEYVGGQAAANIAAATVEVEAATSSNVNSTLVQRDTFGNFSANVITASLNGNASTSTSSVSAIDFTGTLNGDVTGTQGSTVVAFVGGYAAAAVAAAVLATQDATPANTANTLVERDASGNFVANVITAALNGNASTATFATNATTAVNFTGSLLGDVTGTQGATTIASMIVTGKLLTGYSVGTNTPIAATDSILSAFEKIQGQLNATFGTAITDLTGDVSATGPGSVPATIEAIQGKAVIGTTGTVNVVFSNAPTLTGLLSGGSASFTSTIAASNFSGSSSGSNTGDVTLSNTNSIDLAFSSGQLLLAATLNLSAGTVDAGYIPIALSIKSDGLFAEGLAGTPVQIGTSNNIGSAASFSRADHVHQITSAIILGLLLSGYAPGSNTPINAGNTLLQAFENLQAQITAGVGSAVTSLTGDVVGTGPGATATTVEAIQGFAVSSTGPTDAQIFIYNNTTSKWTPQTISGDAGIADTGVLTLATVNSNVGSFGSSTAIPSFTVNAKGLITAASTSPVVAPAGTLTGTTLAANVLSSSLTSVGTITSGVWNGTPLSAAYMLALPVNEIYVGNASNQPTAVAMSGDVAIIASGATTIQNNVVSNAKLAQMGANTLKGNNTVSTGNALDLTIAQINAMLLYVTTVGAIDGGTANANGLFIDASNKIYAQSASATVPGMVNLTVQSFAGAKTFTSPVTIAAASTSALVINTTSFIFDSVNNALGIGTQPATNVMIDGVNTSGASKLVQMTGYGVGSSTGYRGRFARGTVGSPSAVQAGDNLSAISGRGYGTSQFAAASTGVMNIVAGETFTNTSNMTYLTFSATPTGSVTSSEHFRVAATGVTLGPQSASTDLHTVNGGWIRTNKTITGSYSVDTTTTDDIIYSNQSAALTITLPTPTAGRTVVVKDISGLAQTYGITMAPHASEKIEGLAANKVLYTNFGSWTFSSDGTNWWMI
jgi:hypothetical protein